MCGIAGLIGGFDEQHSGRALSNMLENLRHRGPDDGGLTVFPAGRHVVGLGNRRLAILDLSALGHQPMSNPDTGDVVVYNGEIYNSPDLRKNLEQRGLSFRGHSDTEVLLRAYEQWGVECLARLKGMFAFAIWDSQRSRLVLARDHLGIKPLYYTVVPGKGILFASEIRALLASGFIPVRVDRRGLAGLLAYGSVQEPLTILEGVVSLPPASLMEIDPGGDVVASDRYWRIPRPESEKRKMALHDVVEQGR
ncbi:MAG: hypothetical protein GY953_36410, partial [bacterium]|nr:hypothetical protein [bacterium]